jgi:NAD(P)-dependent dehydrogenase (short-subunit alcohol dehydrogenase family)
MRDEKLITSPFLKTSTAQEVIDGMDLSGRRAIVTGGNSGIGVETVRVLANAGAAVTLAVRNVQAGRQVAESLRRDTPAELTLDVEQLELADPDSVRAFASRWQGPLDILVNNAGVMARPLERTPQGWEHQFATNYLGHFLLTLRLKDSLASAPAARIVSLSSTGHFYSPVAFDDINFTARAYDPMLAYGQSKTADVLLAVEATRRWAGDNVTANAVMPGGIRTNLQRHMSGPEWDAVDAAYDWKTVEQGAATTIFVATSPLIDGVGGRYFQDCQEAPVVDPEVGINEQRGVAAWALNPVAASRLWDTAVELLGE